MCTKIEMDMIYEKRSPPTMVTWHNSCVTSKKSYISIFTWLMSTKLGKMMAYGIGPPCTKSHDSLITWLYVVYGHQTRQGNGLWYWCQNSKNNITLSKKSFPLMNFYHLKTVFLILNKATITLILLIREKEAPILTSIILYVTLQEIHGNIWCLIFISLPSSCKTSFLLTGFRLTWKKSFNETVFF